jgi:hypothetical protein
MNDLHEKLLIGMNDKVARIETHVAEIKIDVKEHMRRTAILEAKTSWIERLVWMVFGGTAVVGFFLKIFKVI